MGEGVAAASATATTSDDDEDDDEDRMWQKLPIITFQTFDDLTSGTATTEAGPVSQMTDGRMDGGRTDGPFHSSSCLSSDLLVFLIHVRVAAAAAACLLVWSLPACVSHRLRCCCRLLWGQRH